MTIENILVFSILGAALILFISERIRVDLVALLVLVSLTLTGLVTPEEAFSGFASPAVITVWSVFIISGALTRSGVADVIAKYILRLAGQNPVRLTVLIMLTVGVMSAFMNNIGAVAILLPAVVSVARAANFVFQVVDSARLGLVDGWQHHHDRHTPEYPGSGYPHELSRDPELLVLRFRAYGLDRPDHRDHLHGADRSAAAAGAYARQGVDPGLSYSRISDGGSDYCRFSAAGEKGAGDKLG